jgi:hypothetical protein
MSLARDIDQINRAADRLDFEAAEVLKYQCVEENPAATTPTSAPPKNPSKS